MGRAFEGVTSQSHHVPQQNNFSTQNNISTQNNFSQNNFSQNNFSTRHIPQQNNFSTQNNFSQNDFSQNKFSTQNTFSQTTGTNCGYEPRISSSSSRGEVCARANHRKGSLHRSAEKGFCCVSSRSCGYRIWPTPKTNRNRKSLHTLKPRFPVAHTTHTHHSHTSLQFWTRTVIETLTTPVHLRYQTQVQCITHGVHMKWSYEFTCVP